MSVNDRLYDELLKPLVDSYYRSVQVLAAIPDGAVDRLSRAWHLGRLDALEVEGDRIADVLAVARPGWAAMRDLAVSADVAPTTPGDGTAAADQSFDAAEYPELAGFDRFDRAPVGHVWPQAEPETRLPLTGKR